MNISIRIQGLSVYCVLDMSVSFYFSGSQFTQIHAGPGIYGLCQFYLHMHTHTHTHTHTCTHTHTHTCTHAHMHIHTHIQRGILNSVAATSKVDDIWLMTDPEYLTWRYIAPGSGIFRVYPGVQITNKAFDAVQRPW